MLRARVDPPTGAVVMKDDVQNELCAPLVVLSGDSYRLREAKGVVLSAR